MVTETGRVEQFVDAGLRLLADPLLLYIYVHAVTPTTLPLAVEVAAIIKRTRAKRFGEDLQQYVMDDIMRLAYRLSLFTFRWNPPISSYHLSLDSRQLKGKQKPGVKATPATLKIYLSRTPLDELLPQSKYKKAPVSQPPPVPPPKTSFLPLKVLDSSHPPHGGVSSHNNGKTGLTKILSGVVTRKAS